MTERRPPRRIARGTEHPKSSVCRQDGLSLAIARGVALTTLQELERSFFRGSGAKALPLTAAEDPPTVLVDEPVNPYR